MNKKALLALLLVVTMMLSGCSLVVKNDKVTKTLPVAVVNGETITRGEVQDRMDSIFTSDYCEYLQVYYYYMTGQVYDTTSADFINSNRPYVVDMMVEEKVIAQHMAAMQTATTTDLDEAAFKAEVVKDVTVTDEELQAKYDANVAAAQEALASDPDAFCDSVLNGEIIYVRPAGHRMVKNILIRYSDAYRTAIRSLNTKVTTQESAMTTAKAAVATTTDLDELTGYVTVTVTADVTSDYTDASAESYTVPTYTAEAVSTFPATEDEAEQAVYNAVIDYATARALRDAYAGELAAARDCAFATIDERADAVIARLEAGEDFTAVMMETTDDTGMTEGTAGYAIYEGYADADDFDPAFVAAGMGIETVGGYSAKTRGNDYGYYIVQYASEVTEGVATLDEVREALTAEMLTEKQDTYYSEQVTQWVEASDVKIDLTMMDK